MDRLFGLAAWLSLICLVAEPAWAGAESSADLASYNWSANASPSLANQPPPKRIVKAFLRKHLGFDADPGESIDLCSFRFVNLRDNGMLSLVFGTGVTDRPSCREISIADKTPSGFELYEMTGALDAGSDISDSLQDIRKDGRFEFVLSESLAERQLGCLATWPVIYAWTGSNYSNVSDQFKGFYRQELASREKAISSYGDSPQSHWRKECSQAEAAKLERVLGISANAGLDQAKRLAASKEFFDRNFAVELLADIGTPEARRVLEMLTKEPGVAFAAKYSLSKLSKGPIRPAMAFERVKAP